MQRRCLQSALIGRPAQPGCFWGGAATHAGQHSNQGSDRKSSGLTGSAGRDPPREEIDGRRNVLDPLPQRRHPQFEHVEPLIEPAIDRTPGDVLLEVAARRRDDLHVDRQRPGVSPAQSTATKGVSPRGPP